jgi:hypothetical protein
MPSKVSDSWEKEKKEKKEKIHLVALPEHRQARNAR